MCRLLARASRRRWTLNPAYFPAAANLANLDLIDKKPEDARKRFESVLAKDPKNVQALLALAQMRAKAGGTTEEVASLIGKAVTANPTDPSAAPGADWPVSGQEGGQERALRGPGCGRRLPERPEILDAAGRAQQAAEDYHQALGHLWQAGRAEARFDHCPICAWPIVEMAAKNKQAALESLQKALKVKHGFAGGPARDHDP
jgi:tetratricopeptide (TPR) repeat protein